MKKVSESNWPTHNRFLRKRQGSCLSVFALEKSEYPATCTSEEVVRPTKERVQRQRVTGESVRVKIFFFTTSFTQDIQVNTSQMIKRPALPWSAVHKSSGDVDDRKEIRLLRVTSGSIQTSEK
jgi:hypothetical protein